MMQPVASKPDHDVAYVTDVEGSWDRLASYFVDNPHVRLDADGRVHLSPGVTFVFGGDAIDRGPWSRRIVRTLLDVKQRHPNRVVLLAGNRDLNKLRLVRELDGHPPKRAPDEIRAAPRAAQLQWILANTMGAADAFEHRRAELAIERATSTVEDEDVAQSYVDDLAPDGELARYLEQCQLTFKAGRTLFVHGGIAAEALTVVPGTPDGDLAHLDVDAWMARLENFYVQQMGAFRARVIEPDGRPAWESAILYQAPRKGMKLNPGSVVYGRLADELNNPTLPAPDVVDALLRSGVSRVVVGHTPSGDTPSLVRSSTARAPFEVLIADNSRSRVPSGSKVVVRDDGLVIRGRVILDDGNARDVALALPADDRTTPVGRRMTDGDLVKGPLESGWLVFRYKPAYEVTQRVVVGELGPLVDALE